MHGDCHRTRGIAGIYEDVVTADNPVDDETRLCQRAIVNP